MVYYPVICWVRYAICSHLSHSLTQDDHRHVQAAEPQCPERAKRDGTFMVIWQDMVLHGFYCNPSLSQSIRPWKGETRSENTSPWSVLDFAGGVSSIHHWHLAPQSLTVISMYASVWMSFPLLSIKHAVFCQLSLITRILDALSRFIPSSCVSSCLVVNSHKLLCAEVHQSWCEPHDIPVVAICFILDWYPLNWNQSKITIFLLVKNPMNIFTNHEIFFHMISWLPFFHE